MKKHWGIIIIALAVFTLAGCGNNSQSKSSNAKHVTTHKVDPTKPKVKTSTAFSGRVFTGDWTLNMSPIMFKGDQFIWKYNVPIKMDSTDDDPNGGIYELASLQGNYSYNPKTKVITLHVNKQSKGYLGTDEGLNENKYQSIANASLPSQIHLQCQAKASSGQKYLKLLDSGLHIDSPMFEGNSSGFTYESMVRKYGVNNIGSMMQKETSAETQDSDSQSSDSQNTTINSAQDFSNFLKKYDITSDDEIVANGDSSKEYKGYYMENYSEAYDNPGSVEPDEMVHAKYMVTIPSSEEEIYIFGTNGRIYSGRSSSRSEVQVAVPLNTEYNKRLNNN
ncbi:hypothetical protein [Companilactobacillus kimchiensis]|uniref:Lipoprotein n=1 Tax=Companilactobacillus kimchiensis TaxID=993692 RepID=A0A0R2LFY5_9LACO|nr:hypothetical protein [Companilactobacillus kimchiensis]KRN98741.1 hypothetical protein IV57_GL000854 [Companilactobacillus kimchiensis]